MTIGPLGYVGVFAGALLLSAFLTPVAVRVAQARGILDEPGGHKSHETPVPYLGGTAIVLAFTLAVVAATVLRPPDARVDEILAIVLAAAALSLVGLVDDLRGLPVAVRLAAQIAAAAVLWFVGVRVQLFFSLAPDITLTILWVVGITNAMNLLDNMDGLSAGIATVTGLSFAVIAGLNGQFLVAALGAAVAGCAAGFLWHNRHPARIYMGDSGSLFLGFVLAALGIKLRFDAPRDVTFFVPILVLGVPILDTCLVTLSRLRSGRSVFEGGRDHISHRLVRVGLPVPAAVSLVIGAAISTGWLALIMSRLDRVTGRMLMGFTLAVGGFLLFLLLQVGDDDAAPTDAAAAG